MRLRAKVDANQESIVKQLRQIGASVQSLSAIGKGVPDLLVGYRGRNILLEAKDGAQPPSKRALTVDEVNWIGRWGGQVEIVRSPEDAVRAVLKVVGM